MVKITINNVSYYKLLKDKKISGTKEENIGKELLLDEKYCAEKITKSFFVYVKCEDCKKDIKVKYKDLLRKKRIGKDVLCRSCAKARNWKDNEYREKKIVTGENHWCHGKSGKLSPHFGLKRSEEACRNIRDAVLKIKENGKTVAKIASEKAAETMRREGIYQRNAEKASKTKDKNNSWVVFRCRKYGDLYYRSSLELDFIKTNDVENCDFTIRYWNEGKERRYCPDFISKDKKIVYEIKSDYTWYVDKEKNIKKALATMSCGHSFCLVLYRSKNKSNRDFLPPEYYINPTKKEMEEL